MLLKRKNTAKDILINKIIDSEFEMFGKVKGIGGRASCQDDFDTFYIMRYSQHNVFSFETLFAYMEDISEAEKIGINLITVKYSYMMEETDPEYFERYLKSYLPYVSQDKKALSAAVTKAFEASYQELLYKYPNVLKSGRDLRGGASASIITYLSSEFRTYSDKTLKFAAEDIAVLLEKKINLAECLYNNMAELYGYKNIEDMEEHIVQRMRGNDNLD